jgi:phosphopantetheinyl transferase
MPLILQENIGTDAQIGIWEILEGEEFFLSEGIQVNGYRHREKRLQHLAGRYLLSSLSPSVSLDTICVKEAGKPFQPGATFDFSISHSGHLAAAIFSFNRKVGLDIQLPDPKLEHISGKFLSDREMEILKMNSLSTLDRLTVAWTAKEALIKWFGKGGLDLKADMVLQDIDWEGSKGMVQCHFLKGGSSVKNIVTRKIENAYLSYLID